jgi:hypothetical protein
LTKRPNEKFYHLRITKSEGPYLDWSANGLTDDPRRAWIGNGKAVRAARATFALAWIMERVPSLHGKVKA